MTILIYHQGTGTYFDSDDGVFLVNTADFDHYQLSAFEDGDDDIIADFVESSSAATPFWEALDPFNERPDNPRRRGR